MTDAYKCDKCGEYNRFEPEFSGETRVARMGTPKAYDLCRTCWEEVREFIEGEPHRLAHAEPAHAPEGDSE